jgi:hypothetical protein
MPVLETSIYLGRLGCFSCNHEGRQTATLLVVGDGGYPIMTICDLFASKGLSFQMLIVVGRLEGAVYFSSSSMLVASSVELVR